MCSQSPVAYLLEYCYHQKNQCHFTSGLQIPFTVCCFLQSCKKQHALLWCKCLFVPIKFDLSGRKACISWGQKSYVIFNFIAILLLVLLSLKMDCYHFSVLPSYLPMSVRQETGPNCCFEKLVVDVVKAFFFIAFSLIPPATNGEEPQ